MQEGKKAPAPRRRGGHPVLLAALYLFVALLPLLLAFLQGLPPRGFADELSSALALAAFSMLLMEFVLSGRFNAISGRIGMDVTMRFHQVIARALTVFILVHPFLYTTPIRTALPWDTTGQLTLGLDSGSLVSGILAWVLLASLVMAAIFRDKIPYSYETWRITHGLGAAVIAALGAHHAIEAGRYSGHPYLAGLWLAMLGLALLTLLYVYVIGPLRQSRRPYRVVSVERAALKTWDLAIEPVGHAAVPFEAGQFFWLTLDRSAFGITEHPFSASSCPAERPRIAFTIKESGDFTGRIGKIPVGARAYLDGPHGNMTLAGRAGDGIVFIAGGVGLAPIMSMLRQLRAAPDGRPLKLLYGNRVAEQILYADELERMRDELPLEVEHVLREPPAGWTGATGQFDEALLRRLLQFDGYERWLYVVCGPAPMIDAVEEALRKLGVPIRYILSEKFSYG
ncbi:MAG: ferredoxin reductase family protein [Minwuiales bacterium]|nr:ferredoxin reductase family protein [Minwuiales bacterium]